HTRFSRDWSSDVCSSDLGGITYADVAELDFVVLFLHGVIGHDLVQEIAGLAHAENARGPQVEAAAERVRGLVLRHRLAERGGEIPAPGRDRGERRDPDEVTRAHSGARRRRAVSARTPRAPLQSRRARGSRNRTPPSP